MWTWSPDFCSCWRLWYVRVFNSVTPRTLKFATICLDALTQHDRSRAISCTSNVTSLISTGRTSHEVMAIMTAAIR